MGEHGKHWRVVSVDDAKAVIGQFWDIQDDGGDYTRLIDLYADDAVLVDPFFGTINGKSAIGDYMKKMVELAGESGGRFERIDLCADGETAWVKWNWIMPDRTTDGVTIYRVRDGKIVFYQDFLSTPPETPDGAMS